MNLFGLNSIDEEERRDIARRSLNNLLTSYADEADIFTEIIQNSYDAIIKANDLGLYESGESPELNIIIGRRLSGHHYLYVSDNGIGMSPKTAHQITVPGFSFGKKKGKTIGYKGVGASYFFAASQKISLFTIDHSGEKTSFTVKGSFDWIKNDGESPPAIEADFEASDLSKSLLPKKRGTGIYFQFHPGIRPKDLNGIVIIDNGPEIELRNWASFLSTKTALGSIHDKSNLRIIVNIHLDLGDDNYSQSWRLGKFDLDSRTIGYPFPNLVFKVGKDVAEIDETPSHLKHKHLRRYHAVYKTWSPDELIDSTSTLDEIEIEVLRAHLRSAEGYLCYSTDVLKEINQRLGGRSQLLKHGIRIACDGTPQGRMIDLSLTSSQGLDRQTHIVLSFEGLELDTGRKISADEHIARAINKIGQKIVSILKEYREFMKKKDRPDVSSDLDSWRSSIEGRSQNSLVRELFKEKGLAPVFKVDPDNEQEVIALTVSLITHQILKGYGIQAISGFARYDALIDIKYEKGKDNYSDTLSPRNDEIIIEGDSKVLEFKYSFDELIRDFEDKKKNPQEIDVVICWIIPDLNLARGRIEPTYGEWRDKRCVYGGTHIWFDENDSSRLPVICLKNLVAEALAREEKEKTPGIGTAVLKQLESQDSEALV